MPGLVKVGKTTRLPSERANELSGVTGVPTPFIVAYEDFFEDCDSAESFVHTKLHQLGVRISDDREFFRTSVATVVKVIASVPPDHQVKMDNTVISPDKPSNEPWEGLLHEADRHCFGWDGYFQDFGEALKLYRDAANLGSAAALERLGQMYELGRGVRKDEAKAMEFYKEGGRRGNYYCYGRMAELFMFQGTLDNARKALAMFVRLGEADSWKGPESLRVKQFGLMFWLLVNSVTLTGEVDRELLSLVEKYHREILDLAKELFPDAQSAGNTDQWRRIEKVRRTLGTLVEPNSPWAW